MAFRSLVVALWIVLAGYIAIVIAHHGMGLLPIFFGDIGALIWPGPFNHDFLCFLIVSATWIAWRERWSARGLLLAPVARLGGAGFLLAYLFCLSVVERGDLRRVLVGRQAP